MLKYEDHSLLLNAIEERSEYKNLYKEYPLRKTKIFDRPERAAEADIRTATDNLRRRIPTPP